MMVTQPVARALLLSLFAIWFHLAEASEKIDNSEVCFNNERQGNIINNLSRRLPQCYITTTDLIGHASADNGHSNKPQTDEVTQHIATPKATGDPHHPTNLKTGKIGKKVPLVVLTPDEFKEKILDKHERLKQRQNSTFNSSQTGVNHTYGNSEGQVDVAKVSDNLKSSHHEPHNPKSDELTPSAVNEDSREFDDHQTPTDANVATHYSQVDISNDPIGANPSTPEKGTVNTQQTAVPTARLEQQQNDGEATHSLETGNTREEISTTSPDTLENNVDAKGDGIQIESEMSEHIANAPTSVREINTPDYQNSQVALEVAEYLELDADELLEDDSTTTQLEMSTGTDEDHKGTRFNYAALDAGAIMMAANVESKGKSNLLFEDKDKYWLNPCDKRAWVVIGLSEEVLVDTIVMANFEKYSSSYKSFQVMGSKNYPVNEWVLMGEFQASPGNGEQTFKLSEPGFARYLKFRFLNHYGNEFYCTLSVIRVHGDSMIENFRESYQKSSDAVNEFRETIKLVLDDEIAIGQVLDEVDQNDASSESATIEVDDSTHNKEHQENIDTKETDTFDGSENGHHDTASNVPSVGNGVGETTNTQHIADESSADDSSTLHQHTAHDHQTLRTNDTSTEDISNGSEMVDEVQQYSNVDSKLKEVSSIQQHETSLLTSSSLEVNTTIHTLVSTTCVQKRTTTIKFVPEKWISELSVTQAPSCPPERPHSTQEFSFATPNDSKFDNSEYVYRFCYRIDTPRSSNQSESPSATLGSLNLVITTNTSVACPSGSIPVPGGEIVSSNEAKNKRQLAFCYSLVPLSQVQRPIVDISIVHNTTYHGDRRDENCELCRRVGSGSTNFLCAKYHPVVGDQQDYLEPAEVGTNTKNAQNVNDGKEHTTDPVYSSTKQTAEMESQLDPKADGQQQQAPPPTTPTSQPGQTNARKASSMDNIFSTLTAKIQELEIDQSLFKRYLEDVNGKYAVVFGDLQQDIDQVMAVAENLATQVEALSSIGEAAVEASRTRTSTTEEKLKRLETEVSKLKSQLGYTEGVLADLALLVFLSSIFSAMVATLMTATCSRQRSNKSEVRDRFTITSPQRSRTVSDATMFDDLEQLDIKIPSLPLPEVNPKFTVDTDLPVTKVERAEELASPTKKPRLEVEQGEIARKKTWNEASPYMEFVDSSKNKDKHNPCNQSDGIKRTESESKLNETKTNKQRSDTKNQFNDQNDSQNRIIGVESPKHLNNTLDSSSSKVQPSRLVRLRHFGSFAKVAWTSVKTASSPKKGDV